jgi:hypothetical protein
MMSGPVLDSSGCSLLCPCLPDDEVDNAHVGSWRDCFVVSLFSDDTFPRGGGGEGVRWMG